MKKFLVGVTIIGLFIFVGVFLHGCDDDHPQQQAQASEAQAAPQPEERFCYDYTYEFPKGVTKTIPWEKVKEDSYGGTYVEITLKDKSVIALPYAATVIEKIRVACPESASTGTN